MKSRIFIIASFFIHLFANAQVVGYTDYRGYLHVIENGKTECIEYREVKSYKTGKDFLVYIDPSGALVYYKDQHKWTLEIGGIESYEVSENLCAYSMFGVLKVVENGRPTTLTVKVGTYIVTDDLLVFEDRQNHFLSIYSNGKTTPIADIILHSSKVYFIAKDNSTGVYDYSQQVFYGFQDAELVLQDEFASTLTFDVGKDMIALYDENEMQFKVVENGTEYPLEHLKPLSFEAGKMGLLYVTANRELKWFKEGKVMDLLNYRPDRVMMRDSVVMVIENSYFHVLWNDQLQLLERLVPENIQYGKASIAYIDQAGQLILWQRGKKNIVSKTPVKSFELQNNAVIYKTGLEKVQVYVAGKTYK